MTSSQLTRLLIAMLAVLLVTGAFALGQDSNSTPKTSIVELLRKRHAVLSQLVKVQSEAYRKGETSVEAVFNAHQDLVGVEIELAASDAERITLLEKSVQLARDLEEIATAKFKAGQASQADVLKSQAARLNTEIVLLRTRQKTND